MRINLYFLIFCVIVLLKLLLIIFLKTNENYEFLGGGNDANYYDAYAKYDEDISLNIWPDILRTLNDIGIYSRQAVSNVMVFLGAIIIPSFIAKLATMGIKNHRKSFFWLIAIFSSIYPTIFYYSLDIYRDVFMVFIFLVGVFYTELFIEKKGKFIRFFLFNLIILIGILLYLFRPYLGFSFVSAFLIYNFYNFRKWPLFLSLSLFLITINFLFFMGFLEPLLSYRESFSDIDAGSNLSITFDSPSTFLISFTKSFIYQILGLYFSSAASVFIFLFESLPFTFMLIYLIKNRRYANKFVDYLVIFFAVYSTIWLLGNDNLGTAVRLRIYSYISIMICCLIVFQRKNSFLSKRL